MLRFNSIQVNVTCTRISRINIDQHRKNETAYGTSLARCPIKVLVVRISLVLT